MIRLICKLVNANPTQVGAPAIEEYRTFDVDLPEVEEFLVTPVDYSLTWASLIGAHVLDRKEKP